MASAVMTVEVSWRGMRRWVVRAFVNGVQTLTRVWDSEQEALDDHEILAGILGYHQKCESFWNHLTEPTGFTWKKVSGPAPDEIIFDEGAWLDFEDDDTGGF